MAARTIGEIMTEWADEHDREPVRHEAIRTGEREPIPWVVRLSVARRDGFRCRKCSREMPEMDDMELDHLLPWSAGGGDHSGNLRVLCRDCNQLRSNWNDGDHERERLPTTWWCTTCWLAPELMADMPDDFQADYGDQRHYRPEWSGVSLGAAPFVRVGDTLAYCAWCWGPGNTDEALTFTPRYQRELAACVTYREPEVTS